MKLISFTNNKINLYQIMKMKLSAILIFLVFTFYAASQDKPAYKVYTGTGKKSDYNDILKEAGKVNVVFFGELHDNPVAHWLDL